MRLRQRPALRARPTTRVRVLAVRLLAGGERETAAEVRRLEADPLFERLRPFLRRVPPPSRRWSLGPAGGEDAGWTGRGPELSLIRRLGRARFEKYFLYEEGPLSAAEAAKACGLTEAQARALRAFVLSTALAPAAPPSRRSREEPPALLARLLPARGGGFEPVWLWAHLARGRYAVDYRALAREGFSGQRGVEDFLARIEAVNARQQVVTRLVELICERQEAFLRSGRETDLAVLPPSAAARALSINPSSVTRACAGRSVEASGRARPLRRLLPNRRAVARAHLEEVLAAGGGTDEALRRRLEARGVRLSRRTVNELRAELGRL